MLLVVAPFALKLALALLVLFVVGTLARAAYLKATLEPVS